MAKLANELTWSVSRDKLFRQCKRAYYYQYYGSWGGWEKGCDERTRLLYILKNLTTLPMWAGSIVHEVIAQSLNAYSRAQKKITAADLQTRARLQLRQGWIDSVNKSWLQQPKKTNLSELYYGNGRNLPAEQTETVKEITYGCLENFANSEILAEITAVPYVNWKPVDQLDSFMVEGLKVWVAVDFAFTDPQGALHILDWKTGAERKDDLNVQLACYALYANQEWFVELDKIRLFGAFLRDNVRINEYPIHADTLVEAQNFILESSAAMRALLSSVENNEAEEDKFECCENEKICQRCNFREVCPFAAGKDFGA